jgi:hypothetical protein
MAFLAVALAFVVSAPAGVQVQAAQGSSRTFPETGKMVSGKFLQYWNAHGGLAQQGYPISNTFLERSDTDGKVYTVQYFERAVFELHPENRAPYDVLLSLLGVFQYKQKYPRGAPGQQAPAAGSRLFPETGKRVAGLFLAYWNAHGGLAQQGYPISEEFQEKSDLDGKTYTVQYFQRAVFEYHREKQPPYDVLLSQLGTFRYRARYAAAPANCASPVRPGLWSGAYQSEGTWSGGRFNAVATSRGTMVLDVACNGSVSGTTSIAQLAYKATVTGLGEVINCTSSQELAQTGKVITGTNGLPGFNLTSRITQGALLCNAKDLPGRGPLVAPRTELRGLSFEQQPRAEWSTPDRIGGSDWAPSGLVDLLTRGIQREFAPEGVTFRSTGTWSLAYQK